MPDVQKWDDENPRNACWTLFSAYALPGVPKWDKRSSREKSPALEHFAHFFRKIVSFWDKRALNAGSFTGPLAAEIVDHRAFHVFLQ